MASGGPEPILRHIRKLVTSHRTGPLSDRDLLRRFATSRDEGSFSTLVARHGPMVLRLCERMLHDVHDAEDVFQATFLILSRKAVSRSWQESIAGWLYTLAYRLALNARTAAARRRTHEKRAKIRPVTDFLSDITGRELLAALDQELAWLPERYRAPFVLCCLEGATRDEAAEQLGCPLGTLKSRLERARALLQGALARRGLALSVALLVTQATQTGTSAAVPTQLLQATVQAGLAFTAEQVAAGAVSARVTALVQAGRRVMFISYAKITAAVLIVLGIVGLGSGLLILRLSAGGQEKSKPAESSRPPIMSAEQSKPKMDKQAGVDRHGDPLPPGAIARLGTVRLRHGDSVHQVSMSPDGKTLAAACMNYNFYLWDVTSGRMKRREHRGAGRAVAFSPDGKTLASGGQGEVLIWDSATDRELRRFEVKAKRVTYLTFSSDSKTLACLGEDNTVHLLELASGKQRHQWKGPPNYLSSSLAFSPDARTLAIATTKELLIRLYDTATGTELRQFPGGQQYITGIAFSPDGKTLVSTSGDTLYFWEAATGKQVRQATPEPGGYVKSVLFSPDGKTLFLGGFDVRMWEVGTGKTIRRFAWDRGVGSVECVTLSGDGKTLSTSMDGNTHTVALWDVATGKRLHAFEGHLGGIHTVAFSPDGRLLATGASERNSSPENSVRIWDPATGAPLRQLGKGLGLIYSVAFSPDGRSLAASNEDGTIRLLDPDTGNELRRLAGHRGLITSIAFSADGKLLASRGYDRTIRVWDVAAGKERNSFPGNQDQHVSIALSGDGKVVAEGAYGDRAVRLWEAVTGRELHRFQGFQAGSVTGAFSPDGKLLAVGGQHGAGDELRLCETATGRETQRFPGEQQGTRLVAFSPDGRSLAAVSADSVIHVWEVATGKLRGRFLGYGEVFRSAAFSPDGKSLALGSEDATAYVFDVMWLGRDGRPRRDFLAPKDLQALWADLSHEEAAKGFSAVCALVAAPREAVRFLQEHLRPLPLLEATQQKQVSQWIEDLSSDQFAVRQKASRQLEKLGEHAYPALRATLEGKPSLEARQRLGQLLRGLEEWTPERLRSRRTLEVLEYIGTPQARQVLQELATGSPEARLTQEAKSGLERLSKRTPATR